MVQGGTCLPLPVSRSSVATQKKRKARRRSHRRTPPSRTCVRGAGWHLSAIACQPQQRGAPEKDTGQEVQPQMRADQQDLRPRNKVSWIRDKLPVLGLAPHPPPHL